MYKTLFYKRILLHVALQKGATDGEDGSESESDWGSDSDSESTSSDDEGQYQNIRERFIKKYVS